ncbi:MAG: phosphotransferase [Bdellovibrionales bacterium]
MDRSIVLEAILRPVLDIYDFIYIALPEDFPIVNRICTNLSPRIQVFNVGYTQSLAHTVNELLTRVPQSATAVTVQSGDSYHPPPLQLTDGLGCSRDQFSNRWVTFDLSTHGRITRFQLPVISREHALELVFSGRFTVTDVARFRQDLHDAITRARSPHYALYDGLLRYFNRFSPVPLEESPGWQDFGYLSSYYRFRRNSRFNERAFNAVTFNEVKKSVTKRSRNPAKLVDEIEWFHHLPHDLRFLTPRVFASSTNTADPWLEMEYLASIPLDQIFLYSSCSNEIWNSVLEQMRHILNLFRSEPPPTHITSHRRRLWTQEMYLKKTLSRLAQYETSAQFARLLAGCTVNGIKCLPLELAKEIIREWVESPEFINGFVPAVIHGDLCFSNALYDMRLDQIRLVDPRGRFGAKGVWGDQRYDIAKLYHSCHGFYDFYVNGYFDLVPLGPDSWELQPLATPQQLQLSRHTSEFVRDLSAMPIADLLFMEALLFISMVPLHADKPGSQTAFLLNGLRLLTEAYESRRGRVGAVSA